MVLIGSLILVASMVTFLLTKQLPFYYLAFFVFGLGSGFMMTGFMTGASLSVSNEQQGGVAGLVTAMQGVSAIIAPILSTSLYHANKHIPMGLIVLLATLLSLFMLRVSQKNSPRMKFGRCTIYHKVSYRLLPIRLTD